MGNLPWFVSIPLVIVAFVACTTSQVATPDAPNPTLTTPQPTAQLVATAVPTVAAQSPDADYPKSSETSAPTDAPFPESIPTQSPTNTPAPTATSIPTNTPEPTPTPTSTATPVPTNTPEPTPTPQMVLGSRNNPVPFGQVVEILEGGAPHWALVVSDADSNATERVLSSNRFNDPPQPGNQFYMVKIEAQYLGPDSSYFLSSFGVKVVGQSAVVYTSYDNRCGKIPDELPASTELFTGGSIKGWECWEVPSADEGSLMLFIDEIFGDNRVWFSLK